MDSPKEKKRNRSSSENKISLQLDVNSQRKEKKKSSRSFSNLVGNRTFNSLRWKKGSHTERSDTLGSTRSRSSNNIYESLSRKGSKTHRPSGLKEKYETPGTASKLLEESKEKILALEEEIASMTGGQTQETVLERCNRFEKENTLMKQKCASLKKDFKRISTEKKEKQKQKKREQEEYLHFLKEENETLRKENLSMKEQMILMQQRVLEINKGASDAKTTAERYTISLCEIFEFIEMKKTELQFSGPHFLQKDESDECLSTINVGIQGESFSLLDYI